MEVFFQYLSFLLPRNQQIRVGSNGEWNISNTNKKITPITSLQQHPEIDSDSLTGLQRGKQVLKEETSHLIGRKKGFFLFISGNCTGIDILDY